MAIASVPSDHVVTDPEVVEARRGLATHPD
jgi:hypothetical protein